MINLSKSGNTVVFEFVNNGHYLQNGTIEVPVNSLTLVTDGSDMFTFKKSATNDIFVSGLYSEIGMTKSELETFYKENMVGSTGGSGGVTSGEVQSMIDESISGKADTSAVTEDISAAVSGKANNSAAYGSYQFGESSNQPYIRYKSVSSQNLGNEIYYPKINGKGTLTNNSTWAKNNLNFQLVETSAFTAYTASTDSRIAEDEEVTAAALNALNEEISGKVDTSAFTTALSGKQDTLSAGTGIDITNNVISATGGGGKAVSGGTNISITTGETADTINCTLPIETSSDKSLSVGEANQYGGWMSILNPNYTIGHGNTNFGADNFTFGVGNLVNKDSRVYGRENFVLGKNNDIYSQTATGSCASNYVVGDNNALTNVENCYLFGHNITSSNNGEFVLGVCNNSVSDGTESGNTFFSIGNGTADNARHNAFEIRQNGDIYITLDGQDVKLQDQLGGGSITIDPSLDSGSTNAVANSAITSAFDDIEDRISEDEEVTAAALNAIDEKFDGLKLKKLTQQEYDALSGNTDSNTLYVIA